MITPIDIEELLAFVASRVGEGDDRQAAPAPADIAQWQARSDYAAAKARARRTGDLEPLRQILVDQMDDPGIAAFIAQPVTRANKKLVAASPYKKFAQENQGDMIREIRKLLQEKIGAGRVNNALVVTIAAKILKCEADDIRTIIKRNYGSPRKGRRGRSQ